MKQGLWTVLLTIAMVVATAGALFGAMTIYERDKFDENWLISPTIIEKELRPLYSDEFDANSTEY